MTSQSVHRLVTDRSLGRLDKTRIRVLGLALQYLTLLLPPPPTTLIGAEARHGRRRIDLTWHHPDLGVWFDEIKTRRSPGEPLNDAAWEQIGRYLDLGPKAYPGTFRGVRVLTLGHTEGCVFVSNDGTVTPLRRTPFTRQSIMSAQRTEPETVLPAVIGTARRRAS